MHISHFETARNTMNKALCVVIALSIPTGTALSKPKKETAEITVSVKDCHRWITHRPSADINHKPGVDVRGRRVAPADLSVMRVIKAQDTITFNITYDGLGNLGLRDAEASLLAGDTVVAAVACEIPNGQLEFNGQRLTYPEIGILAASCKKAPE